jgi:hypothetical protein
MCVKIRRKIAGAAKNQPRDARNALSVKKRIKLRGDDFRCLLAHLDQSLDVNVDILKSRSAAA